MINKITEEELNLLEVMSNPISCSNILFSNLDILSAFDENYSEIRKFQFPMLSFDTLYFDDKDKSKRENFEIKKGLGDSYNLGGRKTGKSIISIKVDSLIALFHKSFTWGVIASLDVLHLRGIFEPIITALENHPVLKLLGVHVKRNPWIINAKNGCLLESVNDNITGKSPGQQFYSKHFDKLWREESSFLTPEVSSKQHMASSEMGCVKRFSGMATFTRNSPIGKIFFDLKLQNQVINLPSYASPFWSDKDEEEAINEFGGKSSFGYIIQILGKVIEGSDNVYDIERIRKCYNENKIIKGFEITKDNFYNFREMIIMERPGNVEKVAVALDVGEGSAPTEIIILFKIKDKWVYTYNITTMKLTCDEEFEILDYVMQSCKVNVMGIDTTSGGGKALASKLAAKYDTEEEKRIIWVSFNEKIPVDFDKDENNNYISDKNGSYQYKYEYITDWSIQQLKQLFYNEKMIIPIDFKFDNQFSNIIAMRSKMRTVYGSKVANHLHQAFQVFSIVNWNTEFLDIHPVNQEKPSFRF